MGVETKIEWCHHTWNAWRGCEKISLGCKFCFAEALSRRNPAVLGEWGPKGTRVIAKDWNKPLAWDRAAAKAGERRRIFMSMNDWLEDRLELDEPRARLLKLIDETPNLNWLLLTKRPENFRPLMRRILDAGFLRVSATKRGGAHWNAADWLHDQFRGPPPNVWVGVSVEDQETADARIPALLEIPAALRWVSYEPALGPVDFTPWLESVFVADADPDGPGFVVPGLSWVVVGGESGHGARPFDLQWARDVIRQCRYAGVPVFVKQLGRRPFDPVPEISMTIDGPDGRGRPILLRDKKGGDVSEFPEDLRVREFPNG